MDEHSKADLRQQRFRANYPNEARRLSSPEARAELEKVAANIDRVVEASCKCYGSDMDSYNILINI